MPTKQPAYHCVVNFGDVNPLDHDGWFVVVDRRGIYTPQLWYWDADRMLLAKIELARCFPIKGNENCIGDNRFHPDTPAWFGTPERIKSAASVTGKAPHYLRAQLCDADPCVRAEAYNNLVGCFGIDNFDSQPQKLTRKEAERLCRRLLRQCDKAAKWEEGLAR
jgi:hypothetical protein